MNLQEDLNRFYEYSEKNKEKLKGIKNVAWSELQSKEYTEVKDLFSQITATIPCSKIEGEWYIKTGKDKMSLL